MKFVKRKVYIGFLVVAFFGAGLWVYEELVESFYVSAIHLDSWPKTKYENISCEYSVEHVRKIVNQPFTYLGKGRQFFVFASQDGKYVLKFIKCQRVNVSDLYKKFPLPSFLDAKRQIRLQAKQERTDGIFASIALAAGRLSENTGVVFAHLTQKPELKKSVTLVDKLGFSHTIALDDVPYVLQKRAQEVQPTFEALLASQDYQGVCERFSQLIALIISDAKAHVVDIDSGTIVRNNVAFLADRAIHVDIGTFEVCKNATTPEHIQKQLSHLKPIIEWISTKNPHLAESLKQQLEQSSLGESRQATPA